MAAWADSCMTSPSLPVMISLPRPGRMTTSVSSNSPPNSVQAKPVVRPTSSFSSPRPKRNLGTPKYLATVWLVIRTLCSGPSLTTSRATFRQMPASSRLQIPHPRLPGILPDDGQDGVFGKFDVIRGQAIGLTLLPDEEQLGDVQLFQVRYNPEYG